MPKTIISEGKTSTEAIEKGLKELRLSRNQVDVRIIEEKKKSFFNILDPHVVKVELTVREDAIKKEKTVEKKETKIINSEDIYEATEKIKKFLNDFLTAISKNISYNVNNEDNIIHITIDGDDSVKLIGYRGEALNSLQIILTTIANSKKDTNIKIILDIGDYKDTRKKTLEDLSDKIEKTVLKTGKSVTLEPMTAYERKIIHTRLQDSKYVKTYSIGENDKRRVVIAKK